MREENLQAFTRPTKEGEHQIFAGLLKCSTCGQGLSFARGGSSKTAGGKGGRGSFACNQSRTRGKAYCSFHYISYVDIYEIILADFSVMPGLPRSRKAPLWRWLRP
ncbi:zinc ribbon domain-containing protein [Paenibacillus sp. FSL L8-0436]|uniref:zinc ribbon domain-containing protein n=1 Tax=Paenibacillus sp. FSL L8-0436 TaxID=2954686 RepID=UPI00315887C8